MFYGACSEPHKDSHFTNPKYEVFLSLEFVYKLHDKWKDTMVFYRDFQKEAKNIFYESFVENNVDILR